MRILVDTHVVLWYLEGNQNLSKLRRQAIVDVHNDIFVSMASLWEISIKISIGKLKITRPISDILLQFASQGISVLPIMPGHVMQVATLPFHHPDPFDRMLIAQSQVEFLSIMTNDDIFGAYGTRLL
jgi:PIN domain nuclease of toxin-antitoxin system